MSEPRPIAATARAPSPRVEGAIAYAAQATGVDFSYLLGEARLESSLNPDAKAGTSSAAGLFQFTQGTWLDTLERHGGKYGYGWATDPANRQQALALRFDPQASALMAAELANDNRDQLRGVLGREPDAAELYLAHFLGGDGAARFLTALAANPGQSAAALFPKAAEANRAIFYSPGGQPRSLGEVMELMRGKMTTAMGGAMGIEYGLSPGGEGFGEWGFPAGSMVAFAGEPHSDPSSMPDPVRRPSMADTLASAFGGSPDAMPGHVRTAYGKLQAFGL